MVEEQQTKVQKVSAKLSPSDGWKDTLIRAVKTSVAVLVTGFPVNSLAEFNLDSYQIVIFAAASAGGSIILNRILTWTAS
jgi:hypothetical protein